MDRPRTAVSASSATRWSWAAVGRHARRVERRAVGAAHRCAVARSAGAVSVLSNLPSAVPTLATDGGPRTRPAGTRGRSPRPRQTRSVGSLHRRQLQLGEKRGSAIGPTRRGKGSKIMAISDGHGLPLAVHVASASPHEVTLVDATLAALGISAAERVQLALMPTCARPTASS